MAASRMQDNIERWLIHSELPFEYSKSDENSFQIHVRHAGIPLEIFEPKLQQGVIVIGSKITMKNSQIARYLRFSDGEKEKFARRVADYCHSIQAINKNTTEDGKQKIGVYMVLEKNEEINQQSVFDAMDRVSEMHEKTARYLMKTF